MAEAMFRKMLADKGLTDRFHVESAAVSTEEIGNGIYPPARSCLNYHGIPFDKGRSAWQVTPEACRRFDLLICMDHSNLRWLDRIIPNSERHKVHLMMEYAEGNSDRTRIPDVADPWYTDDFERTYRDLEDGLNGLLKSLC